MNTTSCIAVISFSLVSQALLASSWTAQVGRFAVEENAVSEKIRFEALLPYEVRIRNAEGQFCLQMGAFPYYADAHLLAREIRKLGLADSFVVKSLEGDGNEVYVAREFRETRTDHLAPGGGAFRPDAHPEFRALLSSLDASSAEDFRNELGLQLSALEGDSPVYAIGKLAMADIALSQDQNVRLAEMHLDQILLSSQPDRTIFLEALLTRADIRHYYQREIRDAYACYRYAETLTANPEVLSRIYVEQAACLFELARSAKGTFDEVRQACTRVLDLEGATTSAKAVGSLMRAETYYFGRERAEAIASLTRHKEEFPSHNREKAMANLFLARLYGQKGEMEQARQLLEENLDLERDPQKDHFFWLGTAAPVWDLNSMVAAQFAAKEGDQEFLTEIKALRVEDRALMTANEDESYRYGLGTPNRRYSF